MIPHIVFKLFLRLLDLNLAPCNNLCLMILLFGFSAKELLVHLWCCISRPRLESAWFLIYHVLYYRSGNKPGSPSVAAPAAPQAPARSAKKKVIETEPEPTYTEIAESARSIDLLVLVNCDYCKYKCKTDMIHFKDTLMFQTRVFECVSTLHIHNQLDYFNLAAIWIY